MDPQETNLCLKCTAESNLPKPARVANTSPNKSAERETHAKRATPRNTPQDVPREPPTCSDATAGGSRDPADAVSMSTASVGHSSAGPNGISKPVEKITKLNEIACGNVEPDNALWPDCSNTLKEGIMGQKLLKTESELGDQKKSDDTLAEKKEGEDQSLKNLWAVLALALEQKDQLTEQCRDLEIERKDILQERDRHLEERRRLEESNRNAKRDYFMLKLEWYKTCEEFTLLKQRVEFAEGRLRQLNWTDSFVQMFHIKLDADIGRINGYRLGRLRDTQVSWEEINMAWGAAALLLQMLMRLFNFEPKNYSVAANGDKSHIIMEKSRELPLHRHADSPYADTLLYDQAQVLYLNCMAQFGRELASRFKGFLLNYPVRQDRIADVAARKSYSITISVEREKKEKRWTRALMLMLKNLKQLLDFYAEESRNRGF